MAEINDKPQDIFVAEVNDIADALKQILDDIENGEIDVVGCYDDCDSEEAAHATS